MFGSNRFSNAETDENKAADEETDTPAPAAGEPDLPPKETTPGRRKSRKAGWYRAGRSAATVWGHGPGQRYKSARPSGFLPEKSILSSKKLLLSIAKIRMNCYDLREV